MQTKCLRTCSYHFQKKIKALHPWSGIYHGEFLLWCKINAWDWQATETFMMCSTMREGPFFWIYSCTRFAFIMLGSSAPMMGLLQCKKCNCEEKLGFWYCWLPREPLGHLDLLVTWIAWISWTFESLGGALDF